MFYDSNLCLEKSPSDIEKSQTEFLSPPEQNLIFFLNKIVAMKIYPYKLIKIKFSLHQIFFAHGNNICDFQVMGVSMF